MDEKIIGRVIRTALTFEGSKPNEILALMDHLSGGEAFVATQYEHQFTEELFRAARILNLSVADLRRAVTEKLGREGKDGNIIIPRLIFDETHWPWARSLMLRSLTLTDKFLLCCRFGLFMADARSIIMQEQALVAQPHKWMLELRQFCTNRGYQITWAFKRHKELSHAHGNDALAMWMSKQNGYHGKVIMSPEIGAVAKLCEGYTAKIANFQKKQLAEMIHGNHVI